MGITYGITVADNEDQYINMAEKALEGAGQAASPGAFLVDLIPFREPPSLFSIVTESLTRHTKSNTCRTYISNAGYHRLHAKCTVNGSRGLRSNAKRVSGAVP